MELWAWKKKAYSFHTVLIQVLAFLTTVILIEKFDLETYATLIIYFSYAAISHNFITLGLPIRFSHLLHNGISIRRPLILISIFILIATLASFCVSYLLGLVFLNITILFYNGLIIQIYLVKGQIVTAAFFPILSQCANLFAAYFAPSTDSYIFTWLLFNTILLIIQSILVAKILKTLLSTDNPDKLKFLDVSAYLGSIVEILHARADIILLSFLIKPERLAQYAIAKMIVLGIVTVYLNYTRSYTKEILKISKMPQIVTKIILFYGVSTFLIILAMLYISEIKNLIFQISGLEINKVANIFSSYGVQCVFASITISMGRSILLYQILHGEFRKYFIFLSINLLLMLSAISLVAVYSPNLGLLIFFYGVFELVILLSLIDKVDFSSNLRKKN